MLIDTGVTLWQEELGIGGPPVEAYFITTEDGESIITENGYDVVTEEG